MPKKYKIKKFNQTFANPETIKQETTEKALTYCLKDKKITDVKICKVEPDSDYNTFKTYLGSLAYYNYLLKEKRKKRKIMEAIVRDIRKKLDEYNDVILYFIRQEDLIKNKIIERLPEESR